MSEAQTKPTQTPTKAECYDRFHAMLAVGLRRELERMAAEDRRKTKAATAAS